MRDELLALLEDGPKLQHQLAEWLQQPLFALGRELQAMAAEGLVKQVGNHRRWALVSFQPRPTGRPRKHPVKPPRPELLTRIENVSVASATRPPSDTHTSGVCPRGRHKLARRQELEVLEQRLGIREPNVGHAVCAAAGCGKRFTPDRESERFCSDRCREIGPPTSRRTVVVDGIEYDSVSVAGHPLGEWPATELLRGSSLSEATEIKRP